MRDLIWLSIKITKRSAAGLRSLPSHVGQRVFVARHPVSSGALKLRPTYGTDFPIKPTKKDPITTSFIS